MSSMKDHIKLLRERRDKLRGELEAAKARYDEVDSLLRALEGQPPEEPAQNERRSRRGNLKELVLGMLDEAGASGLSSHACVQWAKERHGVALHPNSVSSLLSRLKADDVAFYDGERYRLKKFAGPRASSTGGFA